MPHDSFGDSGAVGSLAGLAVHRSRKMILPFELRRPTTVEEAAAILDAGGAAARVMAGGIDFVNELKYGAPAGMVVHLGGVAGLDTVRRVDGAIEIGSGVTLDTLLTDEILAEDLPDLAPGLKIIANVRVRWKATVGGNLLARNTLYDLAPVFAALEARLLFRHANGETTDRPVTDIAGPTPGILVAVRIPDAANRRLAYDRSLRPALSVAVGLRVADDAIVGGTAAAGCAYQPIAVAPLPFAAPLAPSGLADAAADIASGWAEALPPPLENWAGTAAYRRRMSSVLARRLIITAGAGA